MSSLVVEAALARYGHEHNRYLQVADAVASCCRRLVSEAGIRATVQWRVKSPVRVRARLERIVLAPPGNGDAAALDALGDLAGVRIATFVEAGREPMVAAIQGAFRDVDVEVKDRPDSFYRATHCQLRLSRKDALELPPELLGLSCEVQVCSLLAQVWSEVEHGLVYAEAGEASPEQQAALHALGRLTEAGDALVTVLLTLEGRAEQ
jgi:ppGpp synthetase/RelA/SpoT-type nucleotidyltranferase